MEYQNYQKFAELFPEIVVGKYSYLRLEAVGMEPLSVEWVGNNQISIMQTYTMNGDLMYDPMITYEIDNTAKTLNALEFEQSMPPRYQRVDEDGNGNSIDGNGRERFIEGLRQSIHVFTFQWLENIAHDGYMPVRANMVIDGEETRVTFNEDGKPILPEPQPVTYEVTVFSYEDGGYDLPMGEFSNGADAEAFACLLKDAGYYSVSLKSINNGVEYLQSITVSLEEAEQNVAAVERFEAIKAKLNTTFESEPEKPEHKNDIIFPDATIGYSEMSLFGYAGEDMLPLLLEKATELFQADHTVYLLYTDNTEAMALDLDEIQNHDGLFGIEREEWESSQEYAALKAADRSSEGRREAELLYGEGNRFGIYQVRGGEELHGVRFASLQEAEQFGIDIKRSNYDLVYTATFPERIEFLTDRQPVLNRIYRDFNEAPPEDYTGRSVSVSDVVVLKYNGDYSSHYVDSVGFVEIDGFLGEEKAVYPVQDREINADATYSQVGNRSRQSQDEEAPSASKRLTLSERLAAAKLKAAEQGKPGTPKDKAWEPESFD